MRSVPALQLHHYPLQLRNAPRSVVCTRVSSCSRNPRGLTSKPSPSMITLGTYRLLHRPEQLRVATLRERRRTVPLEISLARQGFPVKKRLFKQTARKCFLLRHRPLPAQACRPERGTSSGASVSVHSQDSVFLSCVRLRLGGKQALFGKEHRRSEIYTPN